MNDYSIKGVPMASKHEYDLIKNGNLKDIIDDTKPTKKQVIKRDKIYRHNNPRSHVLYGVPVTLPEYQKWTFIFDNEYQAIGIEPTHKMAEQLINEGRYPNKQDIKDMKAFDKAMDKSYKRNKR